MIPLALRALTSVLVALLSTTMLAGSAIAGTLVVGDGLLPPPPPGATCIAVGADTVRCDTFKDFDLDHEPVLELGCGTVYETSTDHRDGIRWYHAGLLVKRHVDENGRGFWSTSSTAVDGPVQLYASWASASSWSVPGDDDTAQERVQGVGLRIRGPAGAPIVQIAGQGALDGVHHGIARGLADDFTPEAWAALNAALCG